MIKKRGRPVGSKNKKPTPAQMQKAASKIAKSKNPISDFQKTLSEWDRMEAQTSPFDLKRLVERLQDALAKSYVDCQKLEKDIAVYQNEILRRDTIIQYLESKVV
jgi:hypothetical protein